MNIKYTITAFMKLTLSVFLVLVSSYVSAAGLDEPHNAVNSISCDNCHDVYAFDQPFLMPPWTAHAPQNIDDIQLNSLCWSCHNDIPVPYVKTHSSLQATNKYGNWTVGCSVCHTPHVQVQNNINGSTYGKLIWTQISLNRITGTVPQKTGFKTVKFLGPTGVNSFADGDGVYDGICEVCHTKTKYFRNDGSGIEHFGSVAGTDCTQCHSHKNGFSHGGSGGVGCEECHGHDPGYGGVPGGKGTYQSHSTHTENDADDLKGPNLACSVCHDTSKFPVFADGQTTLAATTVCDACHSEGGTYDGLNDATVGAKTNWKTSIYDHAGGNPSTLQSGKEKWCATCHDESPSQISGINAPNIVGDEDGAYTYGTGWGYYKTGHGLEAGEQFPSKGGVETLSGRPVGCDSCHDFATAHIDGLAQTFDDGDVAGLDPALYRQGYRLKLINGQEPYQMPRPSNIGNNSDQFRVCFQIGCHDSGPFTNSADLNTNLKVWDTDHWKNIHAYHLDFNNAGLVKSDWSGTENSRMTCVVCHNVHGSTQLAMIRDGKLIDREIGSWIWYKNDATTYIYTNTSNPPEPDDVPLSASDGTAWLSQKSLNLCIPCHNQNIRTTDRTPFQDVAQAPLLKWVGTNGLISDGVAPDSAAGNSIFTFRVSYSDINNDSPSPIEVWVDLNDNLNYESGEKFVMTGTEITDTNMVDGKTYSKSFTIASAGNGVLNYRFYAYDGGLEASGAPTADSTLTILNNPPLLTWTGEDYYLADGVNPDIGGNGATFTFRTNYTDLDNDAATTIQVWVDVNDNGSYEETEKYDLTTSDGKLYTTSLSLALTGDGNLKYRFYAADANSDATGAPTQDSVLTVLAGANTPPTLQFVSAGCTVSGVKPQAGATGADFVFTVRYVDTEGQCPSDTSDIQLWIDANDDLTYDATEQYDLTAIDTGDTDCSDGKLYTTTRALTLAGDNVLNYRFYATDGINTAIGEAASDHTVTVVDALKVRPAGGTGWYSTIQAAIDAIDGAHTVLVDEGTYNEDVVFEFGSNDSNTMVRSVCGPVTTIISGSGSGSVVTFNRYSNSQIDGFQVTGGTTGILATGDDTQQTINNCQIHDNHGLGGGGISVDNSVLTLTNSEIYNNSSDRGAGVRIWRGSGHTINNTIIRNNTAVADGTFDGGGGVYLSQIFSGGITISNSVIRDNVADDPGGGIRVAQVPYSGGAGLTVSDSIISGNTSTSQGGGVYSDNSITNFVRSSITGNTADFGGAIAHPSAGVTTFFENCIIADNQAATAGMAKMNGGTLDIINSTIANNQATATVGGAFYNQLATITIRNSILWENQAATGGHIAYFNGGSMTITDSIIQSGDDGNFTNAPFFIGDVTPVVNGFASEDDPWFVGSGNYHIQASSPAIDNASATYAPALDIDGQNRPQGPADDIGADEFYP